MSALRAEGHDLGRLLACSGLARSTYYYALSHPAKPTRPELREAVAEIFMRTANGCGHRQVAMCLRAELGARVADKTVLKIMREMGIRCGIRRETDYHRYNSYRGVVGETFENIVGRDFSADGPWRKMGTDVTEFKQPWGKAYFAPVYDFGSKEIVAWSTSTSPDMEQQADLLDRLLERMPEGARPVLHSDMGWQYQHAGWCGRLKAAGIVQSMSRKGNCIDNGATEQVFGHIKDEFFRGRTWPDFESFKADLDDYVVHWNTRRRQVKLKGLTPEEFRSQSLVAQSLFKPSQFYREPRFLSGKRSESSGPAEPVLAWTASVQAPLDAHVVIPVDILLQIPLEDIGVGSLPIVVSSALTIEKKFSALALSRRFTPAEAAAGRSARR